MFSLLYSGSSFNQKHLVRRALWLAVKLIWMSGDIPEEEIIYFWGNRGVNVLHNRYFRFATRLFVLALCEQHITVVPYTC